LNTLKGNKSEPAANSGQKIKLFRAVAFVSGCSTGRSRENVNEIVIYVYERATETRLD